MYSRVSIIYSWSLLVLLHLKHAYYLVSFQFFLPHMQDSGYITKEGATRMQDYKVLFHKGISSGHEMPIDWWNFPTVLNCISPAWDWFNQNFIMEGGEDQEGPLLLKRWLTFIGCWLRMRHFYHPLQSTQCSSKYPPTSVCSHKHCWSNSEGHKHTHTKTGVWEGLLRKKRVSVEQTVWYGKAKG